MKNTWPKWDFFLAHASEDQSVAEEIYVRLEPESRPFLDCRSLLLGDNWDEELAIAQRASLITVVLVSDKSNSAYYQREEIASAIALARQDKERHRVVPIFLSKSAKDLDGLPYGLRLKHGIVVTKRTSFDRIAGRLLALLTRVKRHQVKAHKRPTRKLLAALRHHTTWVKNWSKRIQFAGMSQAESTVSSSVALTIDTVPRRFQGREGDSGQKIGELDLLALESNILLIGAPGSGKTTTFKRLAQHIYSKDAGVFKDGQPTPIVIRLREISDSLSLPRLIARELRIECPPEENDIKDKQFHEPAYQKHLLMIRQERLDGIRQTDETPEIQREWDEKEAREVATVTRKITLIDGVPLQDIVVDCVDSSNALLLLDGLDEAPSSLRRAVERDVVDLALSSQSCSFLLSCRSGEVDILESFDVVEICPLSDDQVINIAGKWLEKPDDFLQELKAAPFADLTGRPLFLAHLIVYYRNRRYFPSRPVEVYERSISLLLEEWDSQRHVHRASRYAYFNSSQKIDFLARFAFEIATRFDLNSFTRGDLIKIYRDICRAFSLPADEAIQVAREVESHNGIFHEMSAGRFNFSHLSIQEYLSAYYIVRSPINERIYNHFDDYHAPTAVAVALSSNPSEWFAEFIIRYAKLMTVEPEAFATFIERIAMEQPRFERSRKLGDALILIGFEFRRNVTKELRVLLRHSDLDRHPVAESLAYALSYFVTDPSKELESEVWIKRAIGTGAKEMTFAPTEGYLSRALISHLEDGGFLLLGDRGAPGRQEKPLGKYFSVGEKVRRQLETDS